MASCVKLTFLLFLFGVYQVSSFELDINKEKGKISKGCRGTSTGLGASGTSESRYDMYKRRYTNCTYVDGNLEIKFLENDTKDYDLSFLESIEEVNGYVLIASIYATYVPLVNLRIIRGKELFKFNDGGHYSLFVALNMKPESDTVGLRELRFKHLTEISNGDVKFYNNNLLCYHNTINWKDIISDTARVTMVSNVTQNNCLKCSPACFDNHTNQRHCWGSGRDWCQKLTKEVCHGACDSRCYGPGPKECCHSQCAAGCTGPKSSDCVACKTFYNEGTCVSNCPELIKYDTHTLEGYKNPDGRYKYRTFCVKSCPDHLLTDNKLEACVKTCRPGNYPINSTCVECDGPCPKTCKVESTNHGYDEQIVNAITIKNYTNCTIIEGSLRIVEATFNGDPYLKVPGISIDQLSVFKTVKEITGYLMVQSDNESLTSLSFLSNLMVIHGRELTHEGYALSVMSTHFKSLEMISLKRVENGRMVYFRNKNLCYLQETNFLSLYPPSKRIPTQVVLRSNRNPRDCIAAGEVCDKSCSDDGCWGKGPNKCLACRTFNIDNSSNICIDSCAQVPRMYDSGNRLCRFCDEECNSSCTGEGPEKCDKCKNFELKGFANGTNITRCMSKCPPMFYPDEDNVCHKCDQYCVEGCTGPSREVKDGGCNTCALGIEQVDQDGVLRTWCMHPDTERCPHGHFRSTKPVLDRNSTERMPVCMQCHSMCDGCYEAGASQCMSCRYVKQDNLCTQECVSYAYPDEDNICQPCDKQCSGGCFGPSSEHCNACLHRKIYLDKVDPETGLVPLPEECINSTNECRRDFNCSKDCPPELPNVVPDREAEEEATIVCADDSHPVILAQKLKEENDKKKTDLIIICSVVGGVVGLGLILVIFGYLCVQRAKSQEKTAILTAKMTGYGDDEPVTPTDAKPDMSSLRLIKESELRRGGIIGSGAFGTVYKGFWIPTNEQVKIPVAIKVLQEGTSPNQNKELLEEARVMASVDNPCCIRILAVCMTAQMMLITQLMPLGCLLEYVRKHKENIGSKVLLNWCTQIAKGMSYLEERGIVHRDLAARNVLVQSPGQIRITDFGLAKLLDYNEDEYRASGGKMPIKWLALECIQNRIFTHKSDVWSYGVTVWELLTYGQRPYENVRARDVPDLLEKGERLSQPNVCTIDVYMIMIKCWMLDADSRPTFTELAEEFAKMARDPGRYLVIAGDVLKKIPDDPNTPSRIELITPDTSTNPTMPLEGDKLMRLPSHSYDKNDLARSLSVAADGPEEVMEAEEYLQPHPRHPEEPPTTPLSSKTPLLLQPYREAANAHTVKEIRPPARREKRYGHLESAAAARQQRLDPTRMRGDSVNSRYSSDPVKVLHIDDGVMEQSPPFRNGSIGVGDHRDNIAMRARPKGKDYKQLALDEDNYLQPSSSKPPYTDIIGGPDYLNDNSVFEESPQQQYVQHDPALNFQNPEYFDEVSRSPQHVPNKNFFNNNRSKDYYNDVARKSSQELKPLMISEENSETTV